MEGIIRAFVFDLDGVIIDSNPAIESFWKSEAAKENIHLTNDLIREWIHGRKVGDTINGLFNHLSDKRKKEIEAAGYEFDRTMEPAALKGLVHLIELLHAMRIPTGVVTSSHHSRMLHMLTRLDIQNLFAFFVTAEDVSRGKPDPAPYLKMSEKMNIPNYECLVFEDAVSGIQSATASGMQSIGIGNEHAKPGLLLYGAIDVIPDFTHLQVTDKNISIRNRNIFRTALDL